MARYIDADALLLENFTDAFVDIYDVRIFEHIIENAPSADVAEAVRCKDCKHWSNGRCWGIPFCGDDASYIETEETDFCSYGERKTDNDL